MVIDCISREMAKAKKVYSKERHEYVIPVAEIDWIPAADVRPVVRGKWKCADDEEFSQPHVHCSNCGEYRFAWYRRFSYCPNCGADMRGNND